MAASRIENTERSSTGKKLTVCSEIIAYIAGYKYAPPPVGGAPGESRRTCNSNSSD